MIQRIFFIFVFCFFLCSSQFINVFSKGEAGFYCIKIPDLLVTRNGSFFFFLISLIHINKILTKKKKGVFWRLEKQGLEIGKKNLSF